MQAGETIFCGCGAAVEVPTLRELRSLEPAVFQASDRSRPAGRWSAERGIAFTTGALLILAAAITHWQIAPRRAVLEIRQPAFQEINFDVQRLSPLQAWEAWEHFRDEKLEYRVTPQYLENRAKHRELSYYLYAAWTAAAIGLATIIASLAWPRTRNARPQAT
jgi:hypothetical protein